MKHCGKTSLGKLIAEDYGFECYDLDDITLEMAGPAWKSARSIYNTLGKKEFQLFEEDAARHFVEWIMPNVERPGVILSLGGGVIDNPGALAWLANRGVVVYVHADAELLYARIMKNGRPPFLSEESPKEDFLRLYQTRDAGYRDFAQRLLVSLEKHNERQQFR